MLYLFAQDAHRAAAVEDEYSLHIAVIAGAILKHEIDVVVVMLKVFR